MGPLTLGVDSKSCSGTSSDEYSKKTQYAPIGTRKSFASVSLHEDMPFDFFRTLFVGVIAGGTAGVVVEAALYPIDTIKTRLQGYGSFLLRDLPFDAIQFCLHEQLRLGYKVAANRELNDPENAIIGAFAGI